MASLKSELLASPHWYEVSQAGPGQIDDLNYGYGLIRMHPLHGYLSELSISPNLLQIEFGEQAHDFAIQNWLETDSAVCLVGTNPKIGKYEFRFSRLQVDCSKSGLGSEKQRRVFQIVKLETTTTNPATGITENGYLFLVSQLDLPDIPEGHEY